MPKAPSNRRSQHRTPVPRKRAAHSRRPPVAPDREDPTLATLRQENALLREDLKNQRRFMDDLMKTAGALSIITTDMDHTIRYWNSGAESLFGYSAEEVVGKQKIGILYAAERQSQQAMSQARAHVLQTRTGTTCEVVEKSRDGRDVWMKLNLLPRLDDSGTVTGIIGIGQDITDLKQTEKKLEYSLRKLRRAVGGTIHAMALTVEKRDPYTAGHQRRATDLARTIADEMGLDKDKVDGIRMAGVIHDLGKVYVPADILNKPGKLTQDEFMLIKRHSEAGYDIIKYVEFPWPIGQIVLQHHERINGSGYPAGLRGDQICVEARIIAVADVVESMASHRPYRPALGIDRALEEIQQNRGVLYDQDVVDACLRLFKEKRYSLKSRDDGMAG